MHDEIDEIVLKICMFWYFTRLAWKRLFTAPKWEMVRKGLHKRDILVRKQVIWRTDRRNQISLFFYFFQDGGRPPSCICRTRIWTTLEENLVVFVIVHSLVEIDRVVLIICKFSHFTTLDWKCLFMPQKWGFVWMWHPKWEMVATGSIKGISLNSNTSYDIKIIEIGKKVAEI